MRITKFLIFTLLTLNFLQVNAQIKTIEEFVVKNEELKMLTVRISKNYILSGILPNSKKYFNELNEDKTAFSDNIITLTEQAPNDEIQIELQKLNLSWTMLDKILSNKYDANLAFKVLNYSDRMVKEIDDITNMVLKSTSSQSAKILRLSSNGRMLSQKMLLYYIAHKIKLKSKNIPIRFENAKSELYNVIKLLTDYSEKDPVLQSDQGIQLYMGMITDSYGKVRKTLTFKSTVHPITANIIVNQLTENFDLLTKMIEERYKG